MKKDLVSTFQLLNCRRTTEIMIIKEELLGYSEEIMHDNRGHKYPYFPYPLLINHGGSERGYKGIEIVK